MNRFLAFVSKEFMHLFRDPRTVIILFGIPVVQLLIFGYVISTEIKNARIGILDYSKDEVTYAITNKLLSSGYFILEENLTSFGQIEELFKANRIKEAIVFEADFSEKMAGNEGASLQIITDASDPNTAALLESYTQNILQSYLADQLPEKSAINTSFRMFYNEELRSSSMFVPGSMALILMLISAMMTSISIAREKELGTLEILLVSPLRPIQIILGKVTPYFTLSIANMLVILVIGYFVFEVPIRGSVLLLFAVGLLFILLALSLGIMISTLVKTQQAAMIISLMGLLLPTVLLSGFIFPIRNMPLALQYFSLLMPPRWFLQAIIDIMLKGTGFLLVWKEILILVGMLLIFIAISVKKFRIRLE